MDYLGSIEGGIALRGETGTTLNIHEYQAKQLFQERGIPVQAGFPAKTVSEAIEAWNELGVPLVAVKSQIHAGGRGKGVVYDPDNRELILEGGVHLARSRDDVERLAGSMLGNLLVTRQTGEAGKIVNTIYVEAGSSIVRELYLGMLVDRAAHRVVVMASTEGGMEIEEVAAEKPEAIHKIWIDPNTGLLGFQARNLGLALGMSGASLKSFSKMLNGLWNLFNSLDASMVEINPLVVTGEDEVVALDAKVGFDDNALFRHKDVSELRDITEEDATEAKAAEWDLSYIRLDGNIGCLVNGAGLAMATMDQIKHAGGEPANFLDVGGAASTERVKTAFSIILEDPAVKAIFINIFGGIVRCDVIAEGVVGATRELGLEVPLVVRLEGTNVEEGREILRESGLALHPVESMAEGAEKAVELAGGDA